VVFRRTADEAALLGNFPTTGWALHRAQPGFTGLSSPPTQAATLQPWQNNHTFRFPSYGQNGTRNFPEEPSPRCEVGYTLSVRPVGSALRLRFTFIPTDPAVPASILLPEKVAPAGAVTKVRVDNTSPYWVGHADGVFLVELYRNTVGSAPAPVPYSIWLEEMSFPKGSPPCSPGDESDFNDPFVIRRDIIEIAGQQTLLGISPWFHNVPGTFYGLDPTAPTRSDEDFYRIRLLRGETLTVSLYGWAGLRGTLDVLGPEDMIQGPVSIRSTISAADRAQRSFNQSRTFSWTDRPTLRPLSFVAPRDGEYTIRARPFVAGDPGFYTISFRLHPWNNVHAPAWAR
jgi:hypothetical protein